MSIDIYNETLITFHDAAGLVPRPKGEKKLQYHAIYRWAWKGVRGVKLESVVIANRRLTSKEALNRFFERCGKTREQHAPKRRTPSQRQRTIEKLTAKLEAEGA